MPHIIEQFLRNRAVATVARILLTVPFWGSGLSKLIDFRSGVAEMAQFDLEPAVAFNIATIDVQLGGSLLIIQNRYTWLGAGALGVFTALTIPIAHHFWSMTEEPLVGIWFWQGPISALSVAATILIALARMQSDQLRLRILLICGGIFWVMHDFAADAWIAFVADVGALLSGAVALFFLLVRVTIEWRPSARTVSAA